MSAALEPRHVHPLRWRQAIDVARETCARFFRDGRSLADTMRAYGFAPSRAADWAQAINLIADLHCAPQEASRVAWTERKRTRRA
jgi:hypothetical protein